LQRRLFVNVGPQRLRFHVIAWRVAQAMLTGVAWIVAVVFEVATPADVQLSVVLAFLTL